MPDSDMRIIAASRGKTAMMCLGSIALVALGVWLINDHDSDKTALVGWAALVLFSLFGALGALQLVWPSRLVLTSEGLAFHYLSTTFRRQWVDIRHAEVVQIKSLRFVKLVTKPGIGDLDLGGAWPMPADELLSVIEGYLARFGRANAA